MYAAYVSPEVFLMTNLKLTRDDPHAMQAMLRGVTPAAFLVHSQVRIVEGRLAEAGRDELIVGSLAATKMGIDDARLAVGQSLVLDNRSWKIVGRFEAPGTVMEAEVWTPLSDLQIAARRDNLSCVVVTLDDAEFDDVDTFARQRLDLELVAIRETAYFSKLSETWSANSRVGAITRARGMRALERPAASLSIIGRVKAAVLPVPVWAMPSTSRPSSATGIAAAWIGVAVV